jgi:K(+)-stimulated pyrophosphate-energized sodium pump
LRPWFSAPIFFTGAAGTSTDDAVPAGDRRRCVITSIIGTFFVKLGSNNSIMGALYKGFIATAVLSLIVALAAIVWGWLGWAPDTVHHIDGKSSPAC